MKAEEVFEHLLSRIKERSKLTREDELIELYPASNRFTGHYPWQKIPRADNHDRGIRKLEELGAIRLDDGSLYRFSLVQPRFDELCIEFGVIDSHLPYIYYEADAGIGYANNKEFQFASAKDEYKVFPEMYQHMGTPIQNERICELLGKGKDRLSFNTDDMAREMRRKTGLGSFIVNKAGTLTLRGHRLTKPPST